MSTREESQSLAEELVGHLRLASARIKALTPYVETQDTETRLYKESLAMLINVSWAMANSFHQLDTVLKNEGTLPVSWSQPKAPEPQWRQDSAGNVKVGWVLRYDGADRIVRNVTIHRREPGENDRRVTIQFDGIRAWGDENQVVHVVSDGDTRPRLYGLTDATVNIVGAQADELDHLLGKEPT